MRWWDFLERLLQRLQCIVLSKRQPGIERQPLNTVLTRHGSACWQRGCHREVTQRTAFVLSLIHLSLELLKLVHVLAMILQRACVPLCCSPGLVHSVVHRRNQISWHREKRRRRPARGRRNS